MKYIKVIPLLFFLCLSTALFGLEFDYDMYVISSDLDKNDIDWQVSSELRWKYFSANAVYRDVAGEQTLNYETRIEKNWKYLKIINKRLYVENRINDISIEALGKYPIENKVSDLWILQYIVLGNWELGYRQTWSGENMKPSSKIVAGKSLHRKIDFFLAPADFEYSFYYISQNFKDWSQENKIRFDFWLLSYLSIYFKYELNNEWFRVSNGLRIKI